MLGIAKAVAEKYVFPMLEEGNFYWSRIFKEKQEWKKGDAAHLIFGLTADPSSLQYETEGPNKGKVKTGTLLPVAQIPTPWIYWDIILSCFLLFHPEIWPSEGSLVSEIYETIKKWGFNAPDQYIMFHGLHLRQLDNILGGRDHLRFIQEPLTCLIRLDVTRQLAYSGLGSFEMIPYPKKPDVREVDQYGISTMADWMHRKMSITHRNNAVKKLLHDRTQYWMDETINPC